MPGARLTDVAGIAEYLGLTPEAVRSKAKKGQIPVVRIDGALRFDLRKIDRWIEAATVEATA